MTKKDKHPEGMVRVARGVIPWTAMSISFQNHHGWPSCSCMAVWSALCCEETHWYYFWHHGVGSHRVWLRSTSSDNKAMPIHTQHVCLWTACVMLRSSRGQSGPPIQVSLSEQVWNQLGRRLTVKGWLQQLGLKQILK